MAAQNEVVDSDTPRSDTALTRSGHPPGTPKPPIDPPRRRSSLHFSRAFSCSPRKVDEDSESVNPPVSPREVDLGNGNANQTPINLTRQCTSAADPCVTPGQFAQMQKLFQSAKASLRMDMVFAASPTGSIGSRLPPTGISPAGTNTEDEIEVAHASRSWRYSTAPGILLGFERDVREPVPGASPTLPPLPSDDNIDSDQEPISSGFSSPVSVAVQPIELGSSPPSLPYGVNHVESAAHNVFDLQRQLTELGMTDQVQQEMDLDESPLVARGQRLSADVKAPPEEVTVDIGDDSMVSEPSDGEIFLSEPAKAAAESAKEKRGILRSLFHFRRPSREATPPVQKKYQEQLERVETPCPDPALHELFSRSACPDPLAHLTPHSHAITATTPEGGEWANHQTIRPGQFRPSEPQKSLQPPMPPYQRASSTGSPMAFPKFKSPPPSPRRISLPVLDSPRYASQRPRKKTSFPHMASEHFQPGWYYTQSHSQGPSLNEYSFSTAAAKSTGRSAAPDSLIRDSYRTDTLTPLARPMGRYRKTGIAAVARARGVSKYYGNTSAKRASVQPHRPCGQRPRNRSSVYFRSSPPPQSVDMAHDVQKRPRPRDLEDAIYREDHSPVLDLDEDTRATIRLSLLASETPESQRMGRGLRELSPNVVTSRGDRRLRKKRRPSYWDGDLQEVQNSPARRNANGKIVRGSVRQGAERRVMTSPPKEEVESVRSERVHIEGGENVSFGSKSKGLPDSGGHDGREEMDDIDGTMMQIERDMD